TFKLGGNLAASRTAHLSLFAGNVSSNDNTVRVTMGSDVFDFTGALDSSDGPVWDTYEVDLAVPSGVDAISVEIIDGGGSLVWSNATLQVTENAAVDGRSEHLGVSSLDLAPGSGIVSAGTGLVSQPGTIDIDVPGAVSQAILFWSGAMVGDLPGDDTITIQGIDVTGVQIGDPTFAFPCTPCGALTGNWFFSSYRADITSLGLVGSGANSLQVSMDFAAQNSGAGLLVVYDNGTTGELFLHDGIDVSVGSFPSVRSTTVRQYFDFGAASEERSARLDLFVGGATPGNDVIEVTVGGVAEQYVGLLDASDGAVWDSITLDVTIPAGVSSVTARVFTPEASPIDDVVWISAALSIAGGDAPPPSGGAHGTIAVDPSMTYAGGFATVTVVPTDASGMPLGSGLDVVISASNALIGTVVDHGDGTYTQELAATIVGSDTITATVGGEALGASAVLEVESPPSSIFGVRDDGSVVTYSSIQSAVDHADCDDVVQVFVAPGQYWERVWVWGLSGLTIEALSAESSVSMRGFDLVFSDHVAIRGFDIHSWWHWAGVRLYGGWYSNHDILIDRCVVDDMGDGVSCSSGNANIGIRNCELTGNTLSGIYVWGSGPYYVDGCLLSENGLSGIDAGKGDTEITLAHNQITDNGWICPGCGWGIYRYTWNYAGPERITLLDNAFSGNLGSVQSGKSDKNVYRYDLWIDATDSQAPYTP
ncbi:MAG: right-handed parallel beta-helix repeat-containing protein, partial [Planctomycetes bacterium]|nr:right-handed parallel beta-helix repeat-containing protein [Planctomycetota bacterium]